MYYHDNSFMMASFTVAMKSGKRSSEKIFHGRKAQSHNAATTHSAILIHSVCTTVTAIALAGSGYQPVRQQERYGHQQVKEQT